MAYTTIKKPSDYFNTKLYTGNGSTQSITGVGFQPDWVWCKTRNDTQDHQIIDAVRGVTKTLASNGSAAEFADSNGLTAFGTDGFTLGSSGGINGSGDTLASWNWKANGAGVANTDGSISSTVSANTTSGFSIVSYTGTGANATVGHGLGVAPRMMIFKNRDTNGEGWIVYHESIGNTQRLILDESAAAATSSTFFQDTSPTSSIITLGSNHGTNGTAAMICYAFAEKQGFSKFGSYTGNGSADGTFVYTGFKPAFTILKRTDSADNWLMHDNKRKNEFNPVDTQLFPDLSNAESASSAILDYCSNGFKIRKTGGNINASGGTYIYMAFAEEPLVGDNPCTAR